MNLRIGDDDDPEPNIATCSRTFILLPFIGGSGGGLCGGGGRCLIFSDVLKMHKK